MMLSCFLLIIDDTLLLSYTKENVYTCIHWTKVYSCRIQGSNFEAPSSNPGLVEFQAGQVILELHTLAHL